MAASELLGDAQSGENVHLEVSVTMESPPPPPPPRPAKTSGGPRPAPVGGKRSIHDDRRASTRLMRTLHRGLTKHRGGHYVRIPAATEGGRGGDPLPSEWWRTGVALVYALSNLLLTCVVITAAHERVPDKVLSPPLPDKFFDYVERVPWAFTVTEANGILLMALWFVQWLFLKHKSIIGRRCFFLIGTLYLYRCVTMYITTLPVPSKHFNCAPKLNGDSEAMLRRILGLISGGGLSLTGQQLLCGDFLYSGHTVMLTLAYLFIKEYSPPSLWWYQWICWLLSAGGVVCILIGHEHYSIDVVIAYFITSRLFWWYHTMANSQALRGTPNNYLSRTWWNPLFNFLERNVQTRVPCVFSWPVSLPSCCSRSPCERYSMVQSGRDE